MPLIIYPNYERTYNILLWPHKFRTYGYHIYRKVGEGSAYEKLTSSPLTVNFYKDSPLPGNRNSTYIYKITYLDTSNVEHSYLEESTSRLALGRTVLGNIYPALKLITDKSFQLGKAESCTILVKPRVGVRCSSCFSDITRDTTKRWCDDCQNTTFDGGYVTFSDILVRFSNQGKRLESTQLGYELREAISCQVPSYPLVQSEDIIIRPSGERYFIQGDVRRIQLQSFLLKQVCTVKEILPTSEYYDL